MAPITTIVHFEAPDENMDRFLLITCLRARNYAIIPAAVLLLASAAALALILASS